MKSAYVEVNTTCNLACLFCSRVCEGGSISSKVLKDFFRKYKEGGFEKLVITGGEPMLHPDINELVFFGNELGFEVAVQTNGTLVTREAAKKLKDSKINQLVFSIHSHVPELEDEIMAGKNVLEKQLSGLRNALNEGIFCAVTTVVNKKNYKILPDFYQFMVSEYPSVSHFVLNFVDPVGRAKGNAGIVPKYSEAELYLFRALTKLKEAGKTFRVERVPLCYMAEFAEYSTETRRLITKEPNIINRGRESLSFLDDYFAKYYFKNSACESCRVSCICAGISKGYSEIYGNDELYPLFISPEKIIELSGED
jgi:MoaA/NifB/PqqE/SkfB family radical SAM enzyme